ncbi:MAG: circadian clock KaiB family protein [Methylicorpusculum sp.]|uniref:circadian clock KaiB family protein n=1 Tax=Methylicorpusculum sp. TaxID=2713644 RepID=UPI00271855E6|nr:circadian clock KaiB family protein [Methylicorpusculum sp.]MDO8938300.1 circadian clock KaiB family protein [Methylicorpusculum sp.]MDP2200621.1 circadian clock KaiB family protein [Methylicorpusculum sp.]
MNMKNSLPTELEAMEAAADAHDTAHYVLKLYITGTTPSSMKAIVNIRKICEEHLLGRYDLEIVDISQQPMLAEGEQIIAAPTLIKKLPLPLRRFIGDLSQTERILLGLDLRKVDNKDSSS